MGTDRYVQGPYQWVIERATPFQAKLLEEMREGRSVRHLTAKIRQNYVREGEYPCFNPEWHYDLVPNQDVQPVDENHRIWVSSIPPEFLHGQIPVQKIYAYGRDLHRATRATQTGTRLFLRVSESPTKRIGKYEKVAT